MKKDVFPEWLHFEVFHGCNAKCIMCPVHDSKRQKGPMNYDVFLEGLRQISSWNLKGINLHGTGEPLLYSSLEKCIEQCKITGIPVGFSTNAALLTKERAFTVIDANPNWVSVSFEAVESSTYESIRKGLKYNNVFNNIMNFIELRNSKNLNISISLRYEIHTGINDDQCNKFYQFFRKFLKSKLDEIQFFNILDWPKLDLNKKAKGNIPCNVLNRCFVLNDGTVPLCCLDYDATLNLGNVMEQSIIEIWNSPQLVKIRDLHQRGKRNQVKLCSFCNLPDVRNVLLRYNDFSQTKLSELEQMINLSINTV